MRNIKIKNEINPFMPNKQINEKKPIKWIETRKKEKLNRKDKQKDETESKEKEKEVHE